MSFYSDEVEFLSIVVPTFNRFHYIKDLVDSLHRNMDYPFELIVHDDNSNDGAREQAVEYLKDKVSSLILDYGPQLGLSESINRCVNIAGSKYILMLNSDMVVNGPVIKDMINILKNQFVGLVFPVKYAAGIDMKTDFSKFAISREFGGGCAMGFRRDLFNEIGGFDTTHVCSGNADVSFITRVYRAGYFSVNPIWDGPYIRNTSQEQCASSDTTIKGVGGCNIPKLFGIPKYLYHAKNEHRHNLCDKRQQEAYHGDKGLTNIQYWGKYMESIVQADGSIDWEKAQEHGQAKWKEQITQLRSRNG